MGEWHGMAETVASTTGTSKAWTSTRSEKRTCWIAEEELLANISAMWSSCNSRFRRNFRRNLKWRTRFPFVIHFPIFPFPSKNGIIDWTIWSGWMVIHHDFSVPFFSMASRQAFNAPLPPGWTEHQVRKSEAGIGWPFYWWSIAIAL